MNKTLKTIAWICLSLGLIGTVVDVSVLVFGSKVAGERQTGFQGMGAEVQSGNIPDGKNICIAEDADNDGKPDGDCLKLQAPGQSGQFGQPGARQPNSGSQPLRGAMQQRMMPNNQVGRRINGFGILPLIFLAIMGPILVVVGAVILLVNREPKAAAVKEKKEVKEVKKK